MAQLQLIIELEDGVDTARLTDWLGETMRTMESYEANAEPHVKLGLVHCLLDQGRYDWSFRFA